jgi:hypothetical protein
MNVFMCYLIEGVVPGEGELKKTAGLIDPTGPLSDTLFRGALEFSTAPFPAPQEPATVRAVSLAIAAPLVRHRRDSLLAHFGAEIDAGCAHRERRRPLTLNTPGWPRRMTWVRDLALDDGWRNLARRRPIIRNSLATWYETGVAR